MILLPPSVATETPSSGSLYVTLNVYKGLPPVTISAAPSLATGGVVSWATSTLNEPIGPGATKLPCVSLTWLA